MKGFLLITVVLLTACHPTNRLAKQPSVQELPKNISVNGKLFSALFQQRAAEYRALCLQGYNIARLRITSFTSLSAKKRAIITDIDETILDNSPYAVHQALRGVEYVDADWYDWTGRSAADTMPGAASLLQFAASQQIEVFYVTNRDEVERAGTLKNLQKYNLPNADDRHLLMRQTTSSKEARRQSIMNNHEVVLLMGDNLADFSNLFDKKTEAERTSNTDQLSAQFGEKFIVFPNCNYGDWEGSLYRYNYKYTQVQKDSVIKTVLRAF